MWMDQPAEVKNERGHTGSTHPERHAQRHAQRIGAVEAGGDAVGLKTGPPPTQRLAGRPEVGRYKTWR